MIDPELLSRSVLAFMSFVQGIELLAHLQTGRNSKVETATEFFRIVGVNIRCHIYSRRGTGPLSASAPVRGNILLVHGMTLTGIDDPRMENLGKSFASLGYRVFAPEFSEVAGLVITTDTSVKIRKILLRLNQMLGCRVAMFSASFSAALTLIAAFAEPDSVSAVCTVGTPGSVASTLDFLIGQQGIDDYGTLICMWNCLRVPPAVRRAMFVAAEDNGYIRSEPELPRFLKSMKKKDRALFLRLREDREFRLRRWEVFTSTVRFSRLYDGVSPIEHARPVRFSVHLIHGSDDQVIPPSESILLHQRFQEIGVKSDVCITPLISHGHGSVGLRLADVLRLGSAFGRFLRSVTA